ncbi:3-oxoacyl-[acyl-carrier-protein] reductase [bacterium]|nr:3-oxoacyl-[acyl-carrier-protein] reductase [bacterium]
MEGKLALVTGGTRGIGRGITEALLAAGMRVAVVGTDSERSVKVAAELGPVEQVRGYGCDVSDTEAVTSLVALVGEDLGDIDCLVNNAGITRDGIYIRLKSEDWDRVMAVNLTGTHNFCKAVTRGMMKRRAGRIVNITSVVGQTGNAGQVNYAASKAGQIGLTKSLARELGARNVTVNAVAPGFIQTDMTADLPEDVRSAMLEGIPLGRLGDPADVAAVVLFLLSDASAYVTGQVIGVNGGMAMIG